MKNKLPIADCRLPVEKPEVSRRWFQIANHKSKIVNGFTLVELLVVIAIISVVVAFTVPAYHAVKLNQYEHQTEVEMGQLQAAIAGYKDTFGFYPPDSPQGPLLNQLYYELEGTTLANGTYTTLDSADSVTTTALLSNLKVNGIVNCSKGTGEDAVQAKKFHPRIKAQSNGGLQRRKAVCRLRRRTGPKLHAVGWFLIQPVALRDPGDKQSRRV